jgi:hypothetical protein
MERKETLAFCEISHDKKSGGGYRLADLAAGLAAQVSV